MIFFTSDTHFGHAWLAGHRGFASTEEMDEVLIENWNGAVGPRDTVYHLGDLSFSGMARTADVLRRLNGKVKIVPGNHDKLKHLRHLAESEPGVNLEILPQLHEEKFAQNMPDGTNVVHRIVLCHFPMLMWNRSHYGSIHLHGHSHGTCRYPEGGGKILDVGSDAMSLTPVSLQGVVTRLARTPAVSYDQHTVRPEGEGQTL